jgi:hypothetical protein
MLVNLDKVARALREGMDEERNIALADIQRQFQEKGRGEFVLRDGDRTVRITVTNAVENAGSR